MRSNVREPTKPFACRKQLRCGFRPLRSDCVAAQRADFPPPVAAAPRGSLLFLKNAAPRQQLFPRTENAVIRSHFAHLGLPKFIACQIYCLPNLLLAKFIACQIYCLEE
jgi:hypothetical protein